ncbi:MAG: helix-turn-helix domain-containing protein [Oscillospiraceae bacterium]|nr:helix-turn-helix domain-containing protein [Oscillospiraceae bacterium]
MVRTRTIKEATAYFREKDPQTSLTETAIRMLLRSGAVPSVKVGKKYLVTLEVLERYLTGEIAPMQQEGIPNSKASKVWQIE